MAEENPINTEQQDVSEVTDEDVLGTDPLDHGMDLGDQDGYLEADRYGMTAHEQATSRSWNSRLAEEDTEKPSSVQPPAQDQIPTTDVGGSYSHGGEAGYDTGYSDGNKGFIVEEPDEPAADETVSQRNW